MKSIWNLPLHWKIGISLILAVLAGFLTTPESSLFGVKILAIYAFLGKLFLNALKMLVVPLIASAIITGILEIGQARGFARLGGKTVLYYLMSSLLAILTGLVLVNIVSPGTVNGEPVKDLIGLSVETSNALAEVGGKGAGEIAEVFLRMVPPNIVEAAAEGKMLGIITFSLLFGFFASQLGGSVKEAFQKFWQAVYEVMMKMTDFVMAFAPIGVFGLVAKTVTQTGLDAIGPLAGFFFTVLGSLAVHAFVSLPLVLFFLARVNPIRQFQAMAAALLTAFSTSSSAATLPKTLECITDNAGVSKRVSSFTLPLGATVNMDGTALYECVAAIFIAQAYGADLSFPVQFVIVITALLTSIGVAGIPSASLVAITVILSAIGLPLEGIGLILVVDRILDMCRTTVNVFSDSCAAVVIAKSEGEENILQGNTVRSNQT